MSFQLYFDGVKKGIVVENQWTCLVNSVEKLKRKIVNFEEQLLDPLVHRLLPQIDQLSRQIKIERQELDELLEDENNLNRETEFESICYNLTVFKIKFKNIQKLHSNRVRQKRASYKK
jgi:uncharacterized membrane protein YccC